MAEKLLQYSGTAWNTLSDRPALAAPLAAVGGLWVASKLCSIASFLQFYFLSSPNLDRYKSSPRNSSADSWALITGASDGIGKGFAFELCKRDFNVVLHGRNEQKLKGVRADLIKQWPSRQVLVIVVDGCKKFDAAQLETALRPVKELNLKLLFNNVGGKDRPWFVTLQNLGAEEVGEWIDLNARFHVEITRILLPQLIQNSPAAVVNTNSASGEFPLPFMTIYSSSKAFIKHWSNCMNVEMRAQGHDVHFYNIQTFVVSSNAYPKAVSLSVPSARKFAKHTLDKIGGERRDTPGYWAHGLQKAILTSLPSWMSENTGVQVMREAMASEQNDAKSQ